jgi:hypothetical protein
MYFSGHHALLFPGLTHRSAYLPHSPLYNMRIDPRSKKEWRSGREMAIGSHPDIAPKRLENSQYIMLEPMKAHRKFHIYDRLYIYL